MNYYCLHLLSFDAKNSGKKPREDSNTLDTLSEQKMIPSNDKIIEFINILKPNVNLLMEDANVVSKLNFYFFKLFILTPLPL